jgi:hypothetical protein
MQKREHDLEVHRKNLAIEVGGIVGRIVGRSTSEALQNIARAMRS